MDKLRFLMGVYKDQHLARHTISEIRSAYPKTSEAEIVVISDGIEDLVFKDFCNLYSVRYFFFPGSLPLKAHPGGMWFLRALQVCYNIVGPEFDYLIKVDPDTQIKRPFKYFPAGADFFGNIRHKASDHLQGGCLGFSRHAVEAILDSGLLFDRCYEDNKKYSYQRFKPPYLRKGELWSESWISIEDFILWDIAKRLNLKVAEWDEVKCYTVSIEHTIIDLSGDYAAVHPVVSEEERPDLIQLPSR
jgi:hypothetical protein